MQTVLGVAPVTAPSTNQSCTWPARNSAKPRSEDVTFWFSWCSCCDTAYRKSKPLLWGEHSLSYCSCPSCCAALQQRATGWAVHRETPLLSSQVHDCPWQADGSLALAQRCLWSCLNNSSLRGRASLSKDMLHWELTATSPHSASSSYGKRVWRLGQLTMLHCKQQAEWRNPNAWHRAVSHSAPGVCSAAAGLLFAQQTQPWSAPSAGIDTALWQALQLCTVMKVKRGFPGREKAILSPSGTHWLYDNNFFTKSVNTWQHKKALSCV